MKHTAASLHSRLTTLIPGLGLILLLALPTLSERARVFAQQAEFPGEKIVHLLQEPRHRTVHNDGQLFLLDVQANPGDESFPHTHDQAILLTSIRNANGWSNGTVRAITDYATTPLTHKISNPGPGLLRIIAFVNGGAGVSDDAQDQASGMGMAPQIENPWFRSWRMELAPGEATPLQTHRNPTVVVQGSEGVVQVSRADGITNELARPGDWAWRQPGLPFMLRNVGTTPVIVAINEGRR